MGTNSSSSSAHSLRTRTIRAFPALSEGDRDSPTAAGTGRSPHDAQTWAYTSPQGEAGERLWGSSAPPGPRPSPRGHGCLLRAQSGWSLTQADDPHRPCEHPRRRRRRRRPCLPAKPHGRPTIHRDSPGTTPRHGYVTSRGGATPSP